jgi:outer membrane protein OmpA-like peptidoglycan-associated protein
VIAAASRRALAVGAIAACGLVVASCNDRPAPRSLKDEQTSLRVRMNAPDSTLRPAGQGEGAAPAGPESTFGPAAETASVFRAAEVPAEKLARTTALLSELGARETDAKSIVVDLPADVLFDFDKAVLRPDATPALKKAAELLEGYPDAPVRIVGHTDAKGTDVYNDPLSLRRAQAVAAWLKAQGRSATSVTGAGKRQPVAENAHPDGSDDPDGRQRNRRVEILIDPARTN